MFVLLDCLTKKERAIKGIIRLNIIILSSFSLLTIFPKKSVPFFVNIRYYYY